MAEEHRVLLIDAGAAAGAPHTDDKALSGSGHRFNPIEIEAALVSHPLVAEAAVVEVEDARTGQAVCALVVPSDGDALDLLGGARTVQLVKQLRDHVVREIGAFAKPRQVMILPELPTRGPGELARLLFRDVAEHHET